MQSVFEVLEPLDDDERCLLKSCIESPTSSQSILDQYIQNFKNESKLISSTKIFIVLLTVNKKIAPILKSFYNSHKSLLQFLDPLRENIVEECLQLLYSMLQLDNEIFQNYNWSLLFPYVKSLNISIRWYATHILTTVLSVDDPNSIYSMLELKDQPDSQFVPSLSLLLQAEKLKSYYVELDKPKVNEEQIADRINEVDIKESIVNIYGVVLPYKRNSSSSSSPTTTLNTSKFVHTSTSKYNLQQITVGLSMNNPLLITGSNGCGKTAIIREVARLTGNTDMIEIHLDDQVDSKVLLGTYVCTDVPGEFKWKPGALTQAVIDGKWVLIEDIDRAPFDIITAIVPLLETRKLPLSSRGIILDAHPGFQLFATTQTQSHNLVSGTSINQILSNHFTIINLHNLCNNELNEIITEIYHIDESAASRIVKTFSLLCSIGVASGMELNSDTITSEFDTVNEQTKNKWKDAYRRCGRYLSLRDLLKWCNRVSKLLIANTHSYIIDAVREKIVLEAVHVFCSCLPNIENRISIGEFLCKEDGWNVNSNIIRNKLKDGKPELTITSSIIKIGDTQLISSGEQIQCRYFTQTKQALRLLERLAVCVQHNEPMLLVGETGCGKTSIVQYLASLLGKSLIVQNLNMQSESGDLIGGYKPIELRQLALPLYESFYRLFGSLFEIESNAQFLNIVREAFDNRNWNKFIKALNKFVGKCNEKKDKNENQLYLFQQFQNEFNRFSLQKSQVENNFAFAFIEGPLLKAIKTGQWILLDEINLAPMEVLQRIAGLFEGVSGSICITERGDTEPLQVHPDFRIIAAMNPPTDVGKKDLPPGLRNRFTEIYFDELEDEQDLQMVAEGYLHTMPNPPIKLIVELYLELRNKAKTVLLDGSKQRPRYSLRNLCRALEFSCDCLGFYEPFGALYEGFYTGFLTQLDNDSIVVAEKILTSKFKKSKLNYNKNISNIVIVQDCPVEKGSDTPIDYAQMDKDGKSQFVITKSVTRHLNSLARSVLTRKYPVLLQGPTSSGKTTLVTYLAALTGHKCIRINNHEHTDLQEYTGMYVTDENGRLKFQEGLLAQAVRNGWWIILDELNLAPSEILEALNRLLDDNRELVIPETQEIIKPHRHFMLFATQNPPGIYGGRKVLSRAFRNRFIELHIDDIPYTEIKEILEKRTLLPSQFTSCLIEVMKELQLLRLKSNVFAGKHGFITTRDLLRWANRRPGNYQELADYGYMLLAERLRKPEEINELKQIIEKCCKNNKITLSSLYGYDNPNHWSNNYLDQITRLLQENSDVQSSSTAGLSSVAVTKTLKRLFILVYKCLENKEPVLLVGDTGCGKTTICQLLALLFNQKLTILNCHIHTETADIVGGIRPIRNRSLLLNQIKESLVQLLQKLPPESTVYPNNTITSSDLLLEWIETTTFNALHKYIQTLKSIISDDYLDEYNNILSKCHLLNSIFVWQDGPLVECMRNGDMFLLDEISLAEDAVLERLNSVLEPGRTLMLAEKGSDNIEEIIANERFRILATMNPGGDYGKRELSPALRNRFTEIWVNSIGDNDDLSIILTDRIKTPLKTNTDIDQSSLLCLDYLIKPILSFIDNYTKAFTIHGQSDVLISLRDILSWIDFIKYTVVHQILSPWLGYLHGCFMIIIESIGIGYGLSTAEANRRKEIASNILYNTIEESVKQQVIDEFTQLKSNVRLLNDEKQFGIIPFIIEKGSNESKIPSYAFESPTTYNNLLRVLRSMQLNKPILLEGSPGVGKTSLITALGSCAGHNVIRICLSEQTDLSDLFGSDLPMPISNDSKDGDENNDIQFQWNDGIFIKAMKNGDWILLDELNLAPQQVLEGLNSCLDHRGEVFIPELNQTVRCSPSFRVFACQNPIQEGGGRKGLPKSFLNRFVKVYLDVLSDSDLVFITTALYPQLVTQPNDNIIEKMIKFNSALVQDIIVDKQYGVQGGPWEFNLRDIFRWCDLMIGSQCQGCYDPSEYLHLIYLTKFRTLEDRLCVLRKYNEIFGANLSYNIFPQFLLTDSYLQIGHSIIERKSSSSIISSQVKAKLPFYHNLLPIMQHIIDCINNHWCCHLVGQSSTGKTTVLYILSLLVGRKIKEFTLSSNSDSTELLGCYEQADIGRYIRNLLVNIKEFLYKILISWIFFSDSHYSIDTIDNENNSNEQKKKKRKCDNNDDSGNYNRKDILTVSNSLTNLYEYYSQIETLLSNHSLEFESINKDPNVTSNQQNQILNLISSITVLLGSNQQHIPSNLNDFYNETLLPDINSTVELIKKGIKGRFIWIDGSLLEAIEKGYWVIFDNVNFCNPAILDRLNPLLEKDGYLLVNECGCINGIPRIVYPHENFRLFLVTNPMQGELSRAMRNRCIEIYILPLTKELSLFDTVKLLYSAGISNFDICQSMIQIHNYIQENINKNINLRYLKRWGEYFKEYISKGSDYYYSLIVSLKEVYNISNEVIETMNIPNVLKSTLNPFENPFLIPSFWPDPVYVQDMINDYKKSIIKIQGSTFQYFLLHESQPPNSNYIFSSLLLPYSKYFHNSNEEEGKEEKNDLLYFNKLVPITPYSDSGDLYSEYPTWSGFSKNKEEWNNDFLPRLLIQFIQTSSLSDIEERKHFIDEMIPDYEEIKEIRDYYKNCLLWCLESLKNHPIYSVLMQSNYQFIELLKSTQNIQLVTSILQNGPIILILNHELYRYLEKEINRLINQCGCNEEAKSQLQGIWKKMNRCYRILFVYIFSLPQLYYEYSQIEQIKSSNQITQLKSLSLIHLSYLFHNNMIEESVLPSPLCTQLYDIFEYIDSLLYTENILQNANAYLKIYEYRFLLWNFIHSTTVNGKNLDQSVFIFYWKEFSHHIHKYQSLLTNEVYQNFEIISSNITTIMNIRGSLFDYNDLWTLDGHPILPKTKGYMKGLSKIQRYCNPYSNTARSNLLMLFDLLFDKPLLYIMNDKTKKDLVESYSTIYIENVKFDLIENNKYKESDQFFYKTLPENIIEEVNKSIEAMKSNYLSLIDTTQETLSDQQRNKLIYPKAECIYRWCDIQLWGLFDIVSIREEYEIISCIIQQINKNQIPKSALLSRFITLLYQTSRNPQIIIPYQILYYISEALESNNNNSNNSSSNNNSSNIELIIKNIIFSVYNDLIYSWLQSQWNGYVNIHTIDNTITPELSNLIQGEKSYVKQFNLQKRIINEMIQSPSCLYHPMITTQYLNVIKSLLYNSKPLQLMDLPFKVRQLDNIRSLLTRNILKNDDVLMRDISILNSLVTKTFMSLKSLIPIQSQNIYQEKLNEIENKQNEPIDINVIVECVKQAECQRFRDLVPSYIQPFSNLYSTDLSQCNYPNKFIIINSLKWVYLGCIRCLLLIPSLPVDPLLIPELKLNSIKVVLERYCNEIEYKKWFNFISYGGSDDRNMSVYESIESRIRKLQEKSKILKSKTAIRQKSSSELQFSDLYNELHQFFTTIALPTNIIEIANSFLPSEISEILKINKSNSSIDPLQREQTIQPSIDSFIIHLSTNYSNYYDILNPIFASLEYIKHGLNLLSNEYQFNLQQYSSYNGENSQLYKVIKSALEFPLINNEKSIEMVEPHSQIVSNSTYSQINFLKIPLLKLVLYRVVSSPDYINDDIFSFHKLSLLFISEFRKKRDEIEKKKQEAAAFIKVKVHKQVTTDEENDEEFKKLFPDYQQQMESLLLDESNNENSKDENKKKNINNKSDNDDDELKHKIDVNNQDILWLYTLHSLLFSSNIQYKTVFPSIIYELYSNIISYIEDISLLKNTNLENESQTLNLYFLSVLRDYCQGSFTPNLSIKTQYIHDFRNDPDLPSLIKIYEPVKAFQNRIFDLLKLYPDNSDLQILIRISNGILKLPLSSPIEQVLIGLQLLFSKSDAWLHVRKDDSIAEELKGITSLLIQWRKDELNNWQNMFAFEEQNIDKETCLYFPSLYTIIFSENTTDNENGEVKKSKKYDYMFLNKDTDWIIRKPKNLDNELEINNTYLKEVYDTLETFLSRATIGQFMSRLDLLSQFLTEISVMNRIDSNVKLSTIYNLLNNVYQFYSQFVDFIAQEKKSLRDPIVSELKKKIKISQWDDKTLYALLESSKESHKVIFKYVLKYRKEVLGLPIKDVIFKSFDISYQVGSENVNNDNVQFFLKEPISLYNISASSIPSFVEIKADNKVMNLENIYKIMNKKCVKPIALPLKDFTEMIESLCGNIIERSNQLREEGSMVQAKHQAFTEFLSELGEMGLSYLANDVPPKQKELYYSFLLDSPSLDGITELLKNKSFSLPQNSMYDYILKQNRKENQYYYKNIMQIQRLRVQLVDKITTDLTQTEITKTVGYLEYLLTLQMQQRQVITTISKYVEELMKSVIQIDCFNTQDGNSDYYDGSFFKENRRLLIVLQEQVNEGINLLKTVPECEETKNMNDILLQYTVVIKQILYSYPTEPYPIFVNNQLFNIISNSVREVEKLKSQISSMKVSTYLENYNLSIIKTIDSLINNHLSMINTPIQQTEECNSEIFKKTYEKIITLSMLVFQNYDNDKKDKNDDGSDSTMNYINLHRKCIDLLKYFSILDLIECIKKLIKIYPFVCKSNVEEYQKSIPALLYPIYSIIYFLSKLLQDYISFSKTTSKFHYILLRIVREIFEKGFCKPPKEEENDEEQEGKTQEGVEGTGLGQGKGSKDISDQLEYEEQIEGLKGEEEGSDNENNPEDQDKGLEMESDFNGEITDLPNKSDEEENSEDEDDKSDIEKDMGDIGDDENILDEKMWGEDDEDNEITENEKKEEGEVEGETLEDEMDTKEDDNDKKKKKDKDEDKKKDEDEKKDGEEEEGSEDEINDLNEQEYEDKTFGTQLDNKKEEEEEEKKEDELELDDELNLDGENDESGSEEEKEEENNENDPTELPEDVGYNPEDDKEDNKMEEENQTEENEVQGDNADENDENQEGENEGEGAAVEEEEKDENENNNEEKEEQNVNPNPIDSKDYKDGIQDKSKNNGIGCEKEEEKEEMEEEDDENEGEENKPIQQNSQTKNDSKEDEKEQFQQSTNSNEEQNNQQNEEQNDEEDVKPANPITNQEDVIKEWKKRINKVQESKELISDDKQQDIPPPEINDNNAMEEKESEIEVIAPCEATDGIMPPLLPEDEKEDEKEENNDETENEKHKEENETKVVENDIPSNITDNNNENNENNMEIEDDENNQPIVYTDTLDLSEHYRKNEPLPDDLLNKLREEMENHIKDNSIDNKTKGIYMWSRYELITRDLSLRLCEQLRLILEPLLQSKLEGDYRTGKRINMRKIIPFIASQYKKDKIWLRRTKPSKRNYEVMIVIDDSKSMSETKAGQLACEALTLIAKALSQLEVGEIGICSFGEDVKLLHPFEQPFTSESGEYCMSQFTFNQSKTNYILCLKSIISILNSSRMNNLSSNSNSNQVQLVFMISDGRIDATSREKIKELCIEAHENHQLLVMLIVDNGKESILNTEKINFVGSKVVKTKYIEQYPFPYYIILRDLESLPEILGDALKQWFELIQQTEM